MSEPIRIGRYVVGRELAAGGMASVYLGRMSGPAGFGKTVAIKRMHPQFAKDPEFISMFLDEARITSGLSHPNIVLTLDVLEEPGELLLVMEYIHGGSLASILRAGQSQPTPAAIASAIVVSALNGLHAAHEARTDDGAPLHLVHRDVSPQNILVSADGLAKIADFGIAKAVGQVHATSEGVTKGKQAYMAPEQAIGEAVTPRADVFAAGIVLWEALVGRRLISGANGAERLNALLNLVVTPPSNLVPSLPGALDDVIARALARDPNDRFATASDMALALEDAIAPASARDVGNWVRAAIAKDLASRDEKLADLNRWCRGAAPELASSVRDLAALASTPTAPLPLAQGGTAILAPAETLKSDTAISTERDVVARGLHAVPSRTAIIVGGAVLGGVALIGIVLIVAVLAMRSSITTVGAPSAPPSTEPPVAASTPVTAPPPPPPPAPAPPPSPDPASEQTETAAKLVPAPAPTPVVAVKPKPPAPLASGKPVCRIVPQKDAAGRTVFKEICP